MTIEEGGYTWVVAEREADWILGGPGVVVEWVRGLMGEGIAVRRKDAYGAC